MDLKEKFFSAFKLAIDEEQKAYDLYMTLAEMCDESELKNIFEKFAAEELQHKKTLMDKYKEMKAS
jgi:rubrerythrin